MSEVLSLRHPLQSPRILAFLTVASLLLVTRPASGEPGVGPAEVVIGERSAFTGPSAGLGIEVWRGEWAAFEEANAAGGVHGRKVRLALADDGYEAEKAAPAALRLITQQKVFALFGGVGTPTIVKALPVVLKFHQTEGLFQFSSFTGAQPQREPPYERAVFNIRASYRQETRAMVDAFVAMGRKRIGIFVQDDAYGTSGRDGVKRALKEHGLDVVADTTYPRGQTYGVSTAAQIALLKKASVDAIIAVGSYQPCAALIRDARTSGWQVPIHNVSFVGADQMLELLRKEQKTTQKDLLSNLLMTQVVPSYNDTRVPLVAAYRSAMDRYKPQAPPGVSDGSYKPAATYSFGSLEGYVNAKAFLAILEKTGPNPTRAGFMAAAEKMGRFDIGLGVPLELSPSRHQALDSVWFTYATPEAWAPTANPASIVRS